MMIQMVLEEMEINRRVSWFNKFEHRPLGKIVPFKGKLDESENSMQWLRGFVYEMKGAHTPPNEWCVAFHLSLRDGAVHWYRALSRKTKRDWKLLSNKFIRYYCSQFSQTASTRYYRTKRSDKEHLRDYLNPLNGYARRANVKFENGGREGKEHVKHFLETCGDRDLERQLTPMQLRDMHDLEDTVSDIQRVEKRVTRHDSGQHSSRRDDRRHNYSRNYHGRSDSRNQVTKRVKTSMVALAEATITDLIPELQTRTSLEGTNEYSDEHHNEYGDDDDEDDKNNSVDYYSQGKESSEESVHNYEEGHLAAADDNERREAANGTFARSDKRPQQNGPFQGGFNTNGPRYNIKEGVDFNVHRMVLVPLVEARTIPRVIASDHVNYANKCMTLANAKPSMSSRSSSG
ncbi:hypothetical protein PHMEG_00020660 [Phytophthora megakarya]|uniref:Retrotransposon gag domain-containing protein n=1 Tax=Phytophthora megakarya TaxID=4795 RepID=A0A225VNB6_9STRA|nr:hypothetical protein PHMEG_00020660 [Phytophthora megakarya]